MTQKNTPKQLEELRSTARRQRQRIRAGSETNVRLATKTRRQIARLLTQQNQPAKPAVSQEEKKD